MEGVRLHDLRHTFASMGVITGDAVPVIGKLLGHADMKTTARYAHADDNPVKAAARRISGSISGAMDGAPTAEVMHLRTKGESA